MTEASSRPTLRPGEWLCGCGRIRCGSLLRCHMCGEPQRRRPPVATIQEAARAIETYDLMLQRGWTRLDAMQAALEQDRVRNG